MATVLTQNRVSIAEPLLPEEPEDELEDDPEEPALPDIPPDEPEEPWEPWEPEELELAVKKLSNAPVTIIDDVKSAVTYAIDSCEPTDAVCLAGSLYVAGEAREKFDNDLNKVAT